MFLVGFLSLLLASPAAAKTQEEMGYDDAVLLGAVEGITEYLPVSSTGHLILVSHAMGLEGEDTTADADHDAKSTPTKSALDAYCIIIQIGAILAVLLLYRKDILAVLAGLLGKDPNGLRLGINLIVAFIPAAIIGLLLGNWIEAHLFGPIPVAVALMLGAPLMLGVEAWRKHRINTADGTHADKPLHEMKPRQALTIGLLQCVALFPGTSRSMMTITGGYLVGLSPAESARFSFLLGLITLGAASAYTILKDGAQLTASIPLGPALIGIVIATITAALSVKWLVGYLSRRGLGLFAYYRIVLSILILLLIMI